MKWTEEEIEYLKENYPTNTPLNEITKKVGKTMKAIRHKAARLGLSRLKVPVNKPKDKDYRKKADKRYYEKNKNAINNRKKERIKKYKVEIVRMLGGKCQKCGYNKCDAAFDFHHKKGIKEGDMSRLFKEASKKKLLKEAKKCILLCANCHRELHNRGP